MNFLLLDSPKHRPSTVLSNMATTAPANPRVWFSIAVNGAVLDRVCFELFSDVVPKTAEK